MNLFVANRFRWVLTICAAVSNCAPASGAVPFSQLVIFGDSLADVGNISRATVSIYPGPYYYGDRFSNGPVFVESLSVGLGLGQSLPSTSGGNNFAYGGAQTSGTGGLNGVFIRDIDEQVDQFLATRTADANALYFVFAGANDLVNGQTDTTIPVANLAEGIGRLAAAGARNFLVPNLPLLGHTPRYNDSPTTLAQFNQRSIQFNAALIAMLDNVEISNEELAIFRLDVAAVFSDALDNPGQFGLTNVTDAAAPGLAPGDSSYDTNRIAANANEYLFWDDLHPTTTVHAILAQRALALFDVPGDYNRNGEVDAADYVVWRDMLGQSGMGLAADGDGNREIDLGDYHVWRSHFGRMAKMTAANVEVNSSLAPEPWSFVPIGFALTCILMSRSKGRLRPAQKAG